MVIRHVSLNWLTNTTLYILLECMGDAYMKLSTHSSFYVDVFSVLLGMNIWLYVFVIIHFFF